MADLEEIEVDDEVDTLEVGDMDVLVEVAMEHNAKPLMELKCLRNETNPLFDLVFFESNDLLDLEALLDDAMVSISDSMICCEHFSQNDAMAIVGHVTIKSFISSDIIELGTELETSSIVSF